MALQGRSLRTVRRLALGELCAASTAADGFRVSVSEAVEIAEGGRPIGIRPGDYDAVASYQQAMARVASLTDEPGFEWSVSRLNDLHWMTCHSQFPAQAGRLRDVGSSIVGWDGRAAYQAPPPQEVPALAHELVHHLHDPEPVDDVVVRGAMAHLHLLAISPYVDGNGRLSRIVHSLVLSRENVLPPEFASIEVYLGAHLQGYREALLASLGRSYDPARDASPWLDFCSEAHRQEALRLRDRFDTASARSSLCGRIAARLGYPSRFAIPLEESLAGLEVRNELYRTDADIAVATAKQDLSRLVVAGWLRPEGGGRNVHYTASDRLNGIWERTRQPLLREQELERSRTRQGGLRLAGLREIATLHQVVERRIADACGIQQAEQPIDQRTVNRGRGR